MTLEEMCALLSDELEVPVGPDDLLVLDLGLDSLGLAAVLMTVESRFDVMLDIEALSGVESLKARDLHRIATVQAAMTSLPDLG